MKCDLCNGRVPVPWTYVTPNQAASLQEAQTSDAFWCEDEEWAVCQLCHELIQRGNLQALIARSTDMQHQAMTIMYDPSGLFETAVRDQIIRVLTAFWQHCTDPPTREPTP